VRALAINEKFFGPAHPETKTTLANISKCRSQNTNRKQNEQIEK
jgi:hypothetical protein